MSRLLLVLCLGFGLGATLCAIQYVLIRARRFPRNPYFGLPGFSSKPREVQTRAHEAAMPWIGRAGLLAAVAATIAGVGMAVGGGTEPWDLFGVASAVSGAIAAGVYAYGTSGATRDVAGEHTFAPSERDERDRVGASTASSAQNDVQPAGLAALESDGVPSENLVVDRIARSRELFQLGRHRAALDLLKPAAATEPSPFLQRRALAELYRELGHHDQAGRWGIVIDGWTTDAEQDRLARLLAARELSPRSAREYLAIPSGTAAPALDALVEDRVPGYREQFKAKAARQLEQSPPSSTPAERAGDIGFGFGLIAALAALVCMAVVFAIALLGGETQAIAGGTALIVLLLISLSFAAFGIAQLLEGRVGAGMARIGVGVVLLGVMAGALAVLAAA